MPLSHIGLYCTDSAVHNPVLPSASGALETALLRGEHHPIHWQHSLHAAFPTWKPLGRRHCHQPSKPQHSHLPQLAEHPLNNMQVLSAAENSCEGLQATKAAPG